MTSTMTIGERLVRLLEQGGRDSVTVEADGYRMHVVAGRPGSACFRLSQATAQGGDVLLAEGFTLGAQTMYDQCTVSSAVLERIIDRLLRARETTLVPGPFHAIPEAALAL